MQYSAAADSTLDTQTEVLKQKLAVVARGLDLELVDFGVFYARGRKGSPGMAQIRAVVYKPAAGNAVSIGTDDCARAHRAMLPLLEQAFPGKDISVEVSTPGISRVVKDGVELACYRGRGARCWRTDIADWSAGIIEEVDQQGIIIKGREGSMRLDYAIIAKVRLDPSQEE